MRLLVGIPPVGITLYRLPCFPLQINSAGALSRSASTGLERTTSEAETIPFSADVIENSDLFFLLEIPLSFVLLIPLFTELPVFVSSSFSFLLRNKREIRPLN
ncbi:hypothetical protein L2E82_32659 [Cichorium intybus]|uniref:Uncharacterized protein n=1 Tax=Cichorium intybus TaxID=13427 RepID=A0ACB9BGK8_CICIN|nr:hypothetical protein L2E82_32659 [Cichorium intybus]